MSQTLAIAAGGAAGALMRFWVSNGVHLFMGRAFPYGTLVVNLLGSLVMGLLYVMLLERMSVGPEWRALLMVGFLGAFTTFSTFSLETVHLIGQAEYFKAGLNMVLSVVLCVGAAGLGMLVARQI